MQLLKTIHKQLAFGVALKEQLLLFLQHVFTIKLHIQGPKKVFKVHERVHITLIFFYVRDVPTTVLAIVLLKIWVSYFQAFLQKGSK